MRDRNSGAIYYLFWICIIFLGSIGGLIIISKYIPESLLYLLRGNRLEYTKNTKIEEPPTTVQTTDYLAETAPIETNETEQSEKNDTVEFMTLGAQSPIFKEGEITPTGQFTNYRGTVFVAGTLYFVGTYPQDFEQPHTGPTAKVSVTLAFGWRNLPNFAEIKRSSNNNVPIEISLPPLAILDLQIHVTDMVYSTSSEKIRRKVSEYVQLLFQRQLISDHIIHIAQQRLATAYIAESFHSVELIPY